MWKAIKSLLIEIKSWFPNKSYAQDGEDLILSSFFEEKGYKGRYVDIGAYHPIRYSNTYYFYKKGWNGTLIEPHTKYNLLFKLFRKRDTLINRIVADKNKKMYLYKESAYNTIEESVKKNRELDGIFPIGSKQFKSITLNEAIGKTVIDIVSIDIEGAENIIKDLDFDSIYVRFFIIEDWFISDFNDLFELNDYEIVAKTKRNTIWKKK